MHVRFRTNTNLFFLGISKYSHQNAAILQELDLSRSRLDCSSLTATGTLLPAIAHPQNNNEQHINMDQSLAQTESCDSIIFVSLGMVVLDELHFPSKPTLLDVPGGSGLFGSTHRRKL